MITPILGIDIAKLKFDVALLQDGKYTSQVFQNNTEGLKNYPFGYMKKILYLFMSALRRQEYMETL